MPSAITLPELTTLWLEASKGVFSEKTLELYRSLLENHVFPWFQSRTDISKEEALAFRDAKQQEGLSESVTYTLIRLLSRILDYGAGNGLCPAPEWNLSLPKPKNRRETVILTPEEEQRLVSFLTDTPKPMFLCLFLILTTGITLGEMVEIQWKDVSIRNGYIRAHVSRGSILARKNVTRKVPIGERQRIYLRKLMSQPENYLSSGTPKPRQKAALDSRWRKINDYLLLPPMSLTELRHTFAVRCIEAGMDYETLSKRLGIDNSDRFRHFYRELVSPEQKERLERERFESRKVREAPKHLHKSVVDEESSEYRRKIVARRKELKEELESLEGDLAIVRALRRSDGVQGSSRNGLYDLIQRILGDDKDARFLVEYLRYNMRVDDMPLRKETTSQAIHRHVTKGFEKLADRIDTLNTIEGLELYGSFHTLCQEIREIAPPAPPKRGPKPGQSAKAEYKQAMDALERIRMELMAGK